VIEFRDAADRHARRELATMDDDLHAALADVVGPAAATEILADLEACAAGKRAKRLTPKRRQHHD
jgi:DNA-binding GntR family transcriptional regulator